jgi:glycosyltransferase involved in cell wall biosynthesis
MKANNKKKSIIFLTSYPPVECGIATYTNDLLNEFRKILPVNLDTTVCAIENNKYGAAYPEEIYGVFYSKELHNYIDLAKRLNNDENIEAIFVEHEFGLFGGMYGDYLIYLLKILRKPVFITFHTVLPDPDPYLKTLVEKLGKYASGITVMTNNSAHILNEVYNVDMNKIFVIPHGTHPVDHINKDLMKKKFDLENRFVLSTFGLISRNKSIETMLDAMAPVVERFPEVMYLVLGKTHPQVAGHEGESYREELTEKVKKYNLTNNVRFINRYFTLEELLSYLKATDVYLFTSKDKHQAVSGTLSYAMGTGLPVFSTPIPQAKEVLGNAGLFYDFENSKQLSELLLYTLSNPDIIDELSDYSIKKANSHTWNKISKMHLKMIRKILNKEKISYEEKDI